MRRSGVSASVLCVFALLLCASSQAGTMAENGLGLVAGPVVVPGRTGVGSLGLLRLTSPTAPVDVWFFAIPRTGAPGAAAAEPLESRAVAFEPSEATLLPTVPKDVRITVLPLERPGTYVASVRVLYRIHVDPPEPGAVATTPATPAPAWFELVVDLTVRVDDAPSLKLVSTTEPVKVRSRSTAWLTSRLAPRLARVLRGRRSHSAPISNSFCGTVRKRHGVRVSTVAFSHQSSAARSLKATSVSSRPFVSTEAVRVRRLRGRRVRGACARRRAQGPS